MKQYFPIFLFLIASLLSAQDLQFSYTFADSSENVRLYQNGNLPAPEINHGALLLLQGYRGSNQQNVARFPAELKSLYKSVKIELEFQVGYGGEGFGLALINRNHYTADDSLHLAKWEEPSLAGSFAIGFDIYNPPTSHIFDENGNYYANPQREISLHWAGLERKKILSPIEFRADPQQDEQLKKMSLEIKYLVGGAAISLQIAEQQIFSEYFIPGMQPYPFQVAIGGRTSQLTTNLYLDNLNLAVADKIKKNIEPINVSLIDQQPVFVKYRETSHQVDFPQFETEIERVILNLLISDLPGGYDPWDEGASIYIWQDSTRYELCRFITPYFRGHSWQVDVTDFLPLFRGRKKLDLFVATWMQETEDPSKQQGWEISADLDFYAGAAKLAPFEIKNIWNGEFEYGNPQNPLAANLPTREIKVPAEAKAAKLRVLVTGHGMSPNSQNAAEFMPAERTVFINQSEYKNLLWKTDCYLNSCRPQAGTWKFHRAGWAPGSVVEPWEIEISAQQWAEGKLNLQYLPMAYLNLDKSEVYKPHHIFECQLIFYK
ncbi:MAG: peptide-N-glycosidase F-related protein [Candidatus Cloacimonadales bacterium]